MSKFYLIAAMLLMATPAPAKQPVVEGTLDSHLGEPMMEMNQVFAGQRFPNVVVTLNGTVLTTWGNKNVQARRSEDGGKTWQAPITIADPGFQGGGTTVDEGTGDVLTFVEEHHRLRRLLFSEVRTTVRHGRKNRHRLHLTKRATCRRCI